ncbi:hypothetical protein SARC_05327 [Sphaeroforma arctica JP610]|uniref:Uncharacterized protein n=1 Tax=Sphaeroforma arctica JP610 TaxID=667725 RepID=A0A0L0G004_9EUKA|nr:hypothetical protein SARC_05327 [Sphaeroforma arctica JP610]KNC82400.1 hypothetical protein SARC_05327 [Sphaeroforma arctica JP610]|eukprot:XP_014156302.1 hypothetical protein SARC_05327 [Sphaeroforma arctica JP610]
MNQFATTMQGCVGTRLQPHQQRPTHASSGSMFLRGTMSMSALPMGDVHYYGRMQSHAPSNVLQTRAYGSTHDLTLLPRPQRPQQSQKSPRSIIRKTSTGISLSSQRRAKLSEERKELLRAKDAERKRNERCRMKQTLSPEEIARRKQVDANRRKASRAKARLAKKLSEKADTGIIGQAEPLSLPSSQSVDLKTARGKAKKSSDAGSDSELLGVRLGKWERGVDTLGRTDVSTLHGSEHNINAAFFGSITPVVGMQMMPIDKHADKANATFETLNKQGSVMSSKWEMMVRLGDHVHQHGEDIVLNHSMSGMANVGDKQQLSREVSTSGYSIGTPIGENELVLSNFGSELNLSGQQTSEQHQTRKLQHETQQLYRQPQTQSQIQQLTQSAEALAQANGYALAANTNEAAQSRVGGTGHSYMTPQEGVHAHTRPHSPAEMQQLAFLDNRHVNTNSPVYTLASMHSNTGSLDDVNLMGDTSAKLNSESDTRTVNQTYMYEHYTPPAQGSALQSALGTTFKVQGTSASMSKVTRTRKLMSKEKADELRAKDAKRKRLERAKQKALGIKPSQPPKPSTKEKRDKDAARKRAERARKRLQQQEAKDRALKAGQDSCGGDLASPSSHDSMSYHGGSSTGAMNQATGRHQMVEQVIQTPPSQCQALSPPLSYSHTYAHVSTLDNGMSADVSRGTDLTADEQSPQQQALPQPPQMQQRGGRSYKAHPFTYTQRDVQQSNAVDYRQYYADVGQPHHYSSYAHRAAVTSHMS